MVSRDLLVALHGGDGGGLLAALGEEVDWAGWSSWVGGLVDDVGGAVSDRLFVHLEAKARRCNVEQLARRMPRGAAVQGTELTSSEVGHVEGLFRVVDLDSSGTLEREEFVRLHGGDTLGRHSSPLHT